MKNLSVCIFILAFSFSQAQTIQLSEQATISVVTCGPYQGELYSAFGHSAFRVQDVTNRIDEIYNYGIFDFDQPNFYLNFARGYLNYNLGVHYYKPFRDYYTSHNRFIHEQVLNLTQAQKQKVFNYLQWNALPENQYYYYDYFYDNCATRLRDVIDTVLQDEVAFDGSYIKTDYTIRELTDIYLTEQPWGDLGIDICLGLPMDKKASPSEYMFLPDYIESGFNHATVKQNGVEMPLVKETVIVFKGHEQDSPGGLPNPAYVFSVITLIALTISFRDFKKKKLSTWFDVILFSVVGSIGLLLLLLWTVTDHKAAANNLNILWALPTHLIVVFAFIKQPKWLKHYFLGVSILTILLLAGWFFLPQKLHYSLIPIALAILFRAVTQFRLQKIS